MKHKTAPSKQKPKRENSLTIVDVTAKQSKKQIVVDTKMKNNNPSAQDLKPKLFVLVSGSKVISPNKHSKIPRQIPAKTTAEFKIQFDTAGLDGKVHLRLAFQPIDHSKPEQFFTIGDLTIKKSTATGKQKANKQTTNKTQKSAQASVNKKSTTQKTSGNNNQTATQKPKSNVTNQISLQYQTIGPIKVDVPVGWIKSPYNGGDYGGFKYVNPKDGNEQMLVVYSACAGCGYSDPADKHPDSVGLIPEKDVIHSYVFQSGLAAGYTYYLAGDPYPGNGVVKMTLHNGYAFAEIVLPDSEKSIATKVLNSFQFNGVF